MKKPSHYPLTLRMQVMIVGDTLNPSENCKEFESLDAMDSGAGGVPKRRLTLAIDDTVLPARRKPALLESEPSRDNFRGKGNK